MSPRHLLWLALLPAVSSFAAETPELQRAAGTPQAVGAAHTLRQIPEACARLEGVFTGEAAQPYKFAVVRTSEQCQPRARFVDYDKAQPSEAKGWKLNDVIDPHRRDGPDRRARCGGALDVQVRWRFAQ